MASAKVWGNLSAFVAATVFGGAVVATRVVVEDVPPLNLAVLRFGLGGLILLACLLIGARDLLKVKARDLLYLVFLGGIFFAVFPVTFHVGIRLTEASRGALMIATMPIWSALLARLAGAEQLSWRQLSGILITFTGVGLTIAERGLAWDGNSMVFLGDGLMLLTAFCGAVYGVLAKKMLARYSAMTVTTYAMIFGTLLLCPAAFIEGAPEALAQIDGQSAVLILYLGIMAGAVAYFLWTSALTRLSPTQVAVYSNMNPMVAAVLGVVLLSEKLTPIFVIGFAMTVAGVLLVNCPKRKYL